MSDLCAASTLEPRPGKPEGSVCREWDGQQPGWAVAGPLCETELRCAARDVPMLVFDYLDLAQAAPRSLSQALDGQPSARPGPPVPVAVAPEALQAEIAHVLGTWEEVVRDVCGLSEPPARGINLPWHTTVTRRPPPARLRPGALVQRAAAALAPRLDVLARVGPVAVQPCGVEDAWQEVPGWEAVLALSSLHGRARSMLGRTRRTLRVPGTCSGCGWDEQLRRDEPRQEGDDPPVYCHHCAVSWTYDEYERYVMLLVWPGMAAA